mmetsp:Transcript_26745/g.49104  ORF Transcript_26745/g.49104 Transcript_26745/m.49104 type:complete len:357 (+) Transcript_26745:64-1134(+)
MRRVLASQNVMQWSMTSSRAPVQAVNAIHLTRLRGDRCAARVAEGFNERVGVLGLGKIGGAMARNWLASGIQVSAFDLDSVAVQRLVADGAVEAKSATELVQNSDMVVSVLPNDQVLRAVLLGEDGVLQHFGKDQIHISCSTISPTTARDLAAAHESSGTGIYVGAPVFARPDGMARREAYIPVGGPSAAIKRCLPLLQNTAFEDGVKVFGEDAGAGNVVKLCGNFLIAAAIESMAESLALAEKQGVDREEVMKFLNTSIFDCLIYRGYGHRVAARDHEPYLDAHFALELGLKDVSLVSETAAKVGCPMPVCSVLKDRFLSAKSAGWEKLDWSAIGMRVSQDAGTDVSSALKRLGQ